MMRVTKPERNFYNQITYATVRECRTDRLLEIQPNARITILRGRDSDGYLLALAGLFADLPGDPYRNGETYAVRAHVTWADGCLYKLHGCFNADENTVGVDSIQPESSLQAFRKMRTFLKRRFLESAYTDHIFGNTTCQSCSGTLSESDAALCRFRKFISEVNRRSEQGDGHPIFLYNFLERMDEAVDIGPIGDALTATGRQVFVAVPKNYPVENMIQQWQDKQTSICTI